MEQEEEHEVPRYYKANVTEILEAAREKLGLTEHEMAARIGINSPSYFDLIGDGDEIETLYTIEDLFGICEAMELHPLELLDCERDAGADSFENLRTNLKTICDPLDSDAREAVWLDIGWDVSSVMKDGYYAIVLPVWALGETCRVTGNDWPSVIMSLHQTWKSGDRDRILELSGGAGFRVTVAREKKGLSQKTVARAIGFTLNDYQWLELWRVYDFMLKPDIRTVLRVCRYFDMEPTHLLGRPPGPPDGAAEFAVSHRDLAAQTIDHLRDIATPAGVDWMSVLQVMYHRRRPSVKRGCVIVVVVLLCALGGMFAYFWIEAGKRELQVREAFAREFPGREIVELYPGEGWDNYVEMHIVSQDAADDTTSHSIWTMESHSEGWRITRRQDDRGGMTARVAGGGGVVPRFYMSDELMVELVRLADAGDCEAIYKLWEYRTLGLGMDDAESRYWLKRGVESGCTQTIFLQSRGVVSGD